MTNAPPPTEQRPAARLLAAFCAPFIYNDGKTGGA